MAKQMRYIVGIDEVGRGPLAGPVVVAAVAASTNLELRTSNLGLELKDSKKLTERQREKWFEWIRKSKIVYAASAVYPKVIDRINVTNAANLAATRALARLLGYRVKGVGHRVKILLDGGLYLNKSLNPKRYTLNPCTVVRGDEKFNCIKLASIIAKVKRDRLMKRYHKKYPKYGFDQHKGYGTKAHILSLKRFGLCKLHRLTFLRNYIKLISNIKSQKSKCNSKCKKHPF